MEHSESRISFCGHLMLGTQLSISAQKESDLTLRFDNESLFRFITFSRSRDTLALSMTNQKLLSIFIYSRSRFFSGSETPARRPRVMKPDRGKLRV